MKTATATHVCSVDVSVKLEYGNYNLINTLTDKIKELKRQEY